jgi:hypothetical protein
VAEKQAAEQLERPALEAVPMRVVGSGLLLEGDLDYTVTVKLLYLPGIDDEEEEEKEED